MVQESAFRGVIDFFGRLGIYDVVLPFLLVFTVVFAILEKTKLFGTEHVGGRDFTRKNLNAIVAFVIGFLVVASTKVVAIINEALANFILLLLLGICFLLLFGTFYGQGEDPFKDLGKARWYIGAIMGIAIVLIFLNAVKTSSGKSWLSVILDNLKFNFSSAAVASIVLLIVIVGFIFFIVQEPKGEGKKEDKK